MNIYFETEVNGSVRDIFSRFDKSLFLKLKPPGVKINLIRFDGCEVGDKIHLEMITPLGKNDWIGLITQSFVSDDECYFVDEGEVLPFPISKWAHRHTIRNKNGKTIIVDDINFEVRPKLLGQILYPFFWAIFRYRSPIYRRIFK